METIVTYIRAYDRNCIGCVTKGKDVMIAYTTDNGDDINDLFLTQVQARLLANELAMVVKRNEALETADD